MSLPIIEYLSFINSMVEKERDEHIFEQWCSLLPFMHIKYLKYISFKDYRDHVTGKDLDLRNVDDIIADIDAAHGLR